MKRVNEFGFSAEMLEDKNKEKLAISNSPEAIEDSKATKTPADKKDD